LIDQVLNAIKATNTAFTPSWIDNDPQRILSKLSGFLAPQIGVGDDRDFVAAATAANLYAKVTVDTVLNLSDFFKGNSSDYSSLRKRSSNKTSPLNSDELTRLENYRTIDRYLSPIHQELCMQLSLEDQWQRLLQSMAPNCSTSTGLTLVQDTLKRATKDVKGGDCEESHLHIPPQLETLLDQFVNNISTKGMGRGRTF
jgi:hypothetical protein